MLALAPEEQPVIKCLYTRLLCAVPKHCNGAPETPFAPSGLLWGLLSGTQAYRLHWPLNSYSLGLPAQNWQFAWVLILQPHISSVSCDHTGRTCVRLPRRL